MDQHCEDKYIDQWDIQGFNRSFESTFDKIPSEKWHEEELEINQYSDAVHFRDHFTTEITQPTISAFIAS